MIGKQGSIFSRIGSSAIIIFIVILLLYLLININSLIGINIFTPEQIQATQLAITLIGILLSTRIETDKLERGILEERRKEKRTQKLLILENAEIWISDLFIVIEDIGILKEFSEKDKKDGKLLIPNSKLLELQKELFRLEKRAYLFLGELKELKEWDIQKHVVLLWLLIDTYTEELSKNRIPDIQPMVTSISEARTQITKYKQEL